MKVVGVVGSPRINGNTEILTAHCLEAVAEEGLQTELIRLGGLDIRYCDACYVCREEEICPRDDDLFGVYEKMKEADGIIVASPMFFYGVTAQLKALIDRCQALWVRRNVLKTLPESKKKGVFIGVGATKGKQLFDGSILVIKYFFQSFGAEYTDELLVRGVDKRGEIKEHPDLLKEAFELGQRLVEELG